jgi:lysophospholipase L1-like esterase
MNFDTRICIWGDSIVYGAYDPEHGGWGIRLRNYLEGKSEGWTQVYNLGICGLRTDHLLKSFKTEAALREPDIVIFGIGVNDSKHPKKVSPAAYKKNLAKLVSHAQKFTKKIAFVGLTRIDEKSLEPVQPGETYHSNAAIEIYDRVLEKFCAEEGIPYIPTRDLLVPSDYVDGLHPGTKGHQKMFEKILPFVEALIK